MALFFSGASEKAVLGSGDGWFGMFIADVSRCFSCNVVFLGKIEGPVWYMIH